MYRFVLHLLTPSLRGATVFLHITSKAFIISDIQYYNLKKYEFPLSFCPILLIFSLFYFALIHNLIFLEERYPDPLYLTPDPEPAWSQKLYPAVSVTFRTVINDAGADQASPPVSLLPRNIFLKYKSMIYNKINDPSNFTLFDLY